MESTNEEEKNDPTLFCHGMMPMTMSMSGFQSSLSSSHKADCLTYLFRNWKLDSSGKFQGAMIYTFLVAILCEGMSYGAIRLRKRFRRRSVGSKLCLMILYGTQQFLAWALMLISMIFSMELFVCVILGTVVGKIMFPTTVSMDYRRGRTPAILEGEQTTSAQTRFNDQSQQQEELIQTTTASPSESSSPHVNFRRRHRR